MIQQENIHYLISDSIYIALVIVKEKEVRHSLLHLSSNYDSQGREYLSDLLLFCITQNNIYFFLTRLQYSLLYRYRLSCLTSEMQSRYHIYTLMYILVSIWIPTMIRQGRCEIESRLYLLSTRI